MVSATIQSSCSPIGELPVANSRAKSFVGAIFSKRAFASQPSGFAERATSQFREREQMSQVGKDCGLGWSTNFEMPARVE
jgi:hypothetical protein